MSTVATDLAWAAGFFDGEGNTYARYYRRDDRHYLAMQLHQVDRAVLGKFQSIIGGRIWGPYHYGPAHHQPRWTWGIGNRGDCLLALNKMWDWLSDVKRMQACTMIERTVSAWT